MDAAIDFPTLLSEPIGLLMAAVLLLAVTGVLYRLSGARARKLRQRRADLRKRAARAASPRERRELMLQWSELGGLRELNRRQHRDTAREQGRQARAEGRPLSANPFGARWWGAGREWRQGWYSVDRNIRWIEGHRDSEDLA